IVADFTDAASMRIRGQMEHADPVKMPALWVKYQQMRRLEQQIVARADHLLFASERDRQAIMAAASKPASVMPNGVDVAYWKRACPELGRSAIAFTGAMNYRPNVDAALFLIEEVFPQVRQ